MPARLNHLLSSGASRSLAIRANPSPSALLAVHQRSALLAQSTFSRRGYAEEKNPPKATGPNQDVLPHVSEEAADMGNVMGETKPDIGQGTPIQEILERDPESKEKAPQVIRDDMETDRSASMALENQEALAQMEVIANGFKFGIPELPIPARAHLKHRYEPIISQVTNLLMKDGKLSVAQRNMSFILKHLRTAPAPKPNPARPLIPGSPPTATLPLNPIQYLTVAIDSVAPLLRIRSQKGAAGGGVSLQIPVPLGLRQRRRQAVQWILDAVNKKQSRGSGRGQFAQRFAEEVISVVEGRSAAWEKRGFVHKTGTGARANLNYSSFRRR